jgi:hypothetical protein
LALRSEAPHRRGSKLELADKSSTSRKAREKWGAERSVALQLMVAARRKVPHRALDPVREDKRKMGRRKLKDVSKREAGAVT